MFVNTEYFSPVALKGQTRAPKGSYEYKEWWYEQRKRCLEGYTVGDTTITGPHYWYLNFWKIRGLDYRTGRKGLIHPRFLDIDYDVFHEIKLSRDAGQNWACAKKRQCGLSEKAAALIGHEFCMWPGSQSVIVAGEEKYAQNTMGFLMRGLNQLQGSAFYKTRNPDKPEHIMARKKKKDGSYEGYMSEVYRLTAKNNPEVVSSKSPSFILFEEAGRFPKMIKTFGFVRPSLESEDKATGFAMFIGTGGDMDEGVEDFSSVFYNPEKYNCRSYDNPYTNDPDAKEICYFMPGERYYIIDKDGNSLIEESKAKMHENREKAANSSRQEDLLQEVIARPESPDEIFLIIEDNIFDQVKLNNQRAKILNSKKLSSMPFNATIDWVYDNIPIPGNPRGSKIGVKWKEDKDGPFLIVMPPELDPDGETKNNRYFGGTDSYDKDEAKASNSKGSCSIFDGLSRTFVARVTERPPKAELFYDMTAKLCWLYNARNLIEWSNIGIFGWYQRNGLTRFLEERPEIVYENMKFTQTSNKYGVDPSSRSFWLRSYADYIYEDSERMYDIVQINKALLFRDKDKDPKYNCDITISSSLSYLNFLNRVNFVPKEENMTKEEKIGIHYYKLVNGVMKMNIA